MTSDELRTTSDKLYPRMNYFFSFVIRHSSLVISLCAALVAAAQTDFSLTGWRYWTALDPPKPNLRGELRARDTLSFNPCAGAARARGSPDSGRFSGGG